MGELATVAGRTWWDLVEDLAASTPDRTLLTDTRGRALTCRQYRDAAERAAAGLHELGLRPGMVLSWQLPTTLEAAVLMSAAARLGLVQNPLMPVLRDRELDHIFTQLRPDALVAPRQFRGYDHAALAERIAAGHGARPVICDLSLAEDLALPQADPATLPKAAGPGHVPRWVFYTSGTTGTPKGVRHTDPSVLAASNGFISELLVGPGDVVSVAFPMTHIGGPAMMAAALRSGARTVLTDVFNPVTTPDQFAKAGVTLLGSASPFFEAYLAAQARHGEQKLFPSLRLCVNGGAPPLAAHYERLPRELGAGLYNGYGMTECPVLGFTPYAPDGPPPADGDVMVPAAGVEVMATDPDGRRLPGGEEGELRVRGPQLFSGYVGVGDAASSLDHEGFFASGDLGVVDSTGAFRVTGRLKDVILRNAESISAPYVEAELAMHPDIAEVSVVGLADPRSGERCCAFVVLAEGARRLRLQDLNQFCTQRGLARYQIPEQLELVESLPRTPMGKVQKHVLRDLAEHGTAHHLPES
jgi:acyl-CoA synthetase (AMP-forming)/AMP-acid ligase II